MLELTPEQMTIFSKKLDAMAILFQGHVMQDDRRNEYIGVMLSAKQRGQYNTFERLCIAIDRTKERFNTWPYPKDILGTIDESY